jgi:hypothetical protein
VVIVDMRLRGMSWMDITLHYGLGPEIYYVPVAVVHDHPPYGRAYGYYKKHRHHDDWRRIHLRDADIVNQVNLKFMTEHYRYSPEKVMQYRDKGRRFPVINREIWRDHHTRGGERYIYGGKPHKRDLDRDRQYDEKYFRSTSQKKSDKVLRQEDRGTPQKMGKQDIRKSERSVPQKREMQDVRKIERKTSRDKGGYQSQPRAHDNKEVRMEGNDKGRDDKHGKKDKD